MTNDEKVIEILGDTASAILAALNEKDAKIAELTNKIAALELTIQTGAETMTKMAAEIEDLKKQLADLQNPPAPDPAPEPEPQPEPPTPIGDSDFPTPSLEFAKFNSATGWFESQPGWQSKIFALGFSVPACNYGKKLIIEYEIAAKLTTQKKNIKILRGWDQAMTSPTGNRCNFYIGQNMDGWKKMFTEGTSIPAASQTQGFSFPTTEPRRERYEIVFPTGVGKTDGTVRKLINGVEEFKKYGWQFDTPSKPGIQTRWFIQIDYSPQTGDSGPFPSDNWVRVMPVRVAVAPILLAD